MLTFNPQSGLFSKQNSNDNNYVDFNETVLNMFFTKCINQKTVI